MYSSQAQWLGNLIDTSTQFARAKIKESDKESSLQKVSNEALLYNWPQIDLYNWSIKIRT